MVTLTTYKVTARVHLRYALKERPTLKTGYPLAAGDSIVTTKEALQWLQVITAAGKPASAKAYVIQKIDL